MKSAKNFWIFDKQTDEEKTIKKFEELLAFPHVCKFVKNKKLPMDAGQFELRPYNKKSTDGFYLSIQCSNCGYGKEIVISREDAVILRKYYIEKKIYKFDWFKKMECMFCQYENKIMEHCPFYPRRALGVCKGIWDEEAEEKQHIANKIFP